MKKVIYIVLSLSLILLQFSCGNNNQTKTLEVTSEVLNTESEEKAPKEEKATIQLTFDGIKTVADYGEEELAEKYESIKFGKYEQDNSLDNGKEDIEWIVLEKNENKFLLISKYILDKIQYDEEHGFNDWNNSTLRNWLNSNFYEETFDEEEKSIIVRNNYPNYAIVYGVSKLTKKNAYEGYSSDDLVSILGFHEATKYFGNISDPDEKENDNKKVVAKPTPYARREVGQHKITIDIDKSNRWNKGCAPYWLRSLFAVFSRNETNSAAKIAYDGTLTYDIFNEEYTGVRPIILIDISKVSEEKSKKMLSYDQDYAFVKLGEEQINKTSKTIDSWEMEFYNKSIDDFKHSYYDEVKNYGNNTSKKPVYVREVDGSTIFTYGLKDVNNDGLNELLIFNKNNLLRVYRLDNPYDDYEKYRDEFYAEEVYSRALWQNKEDDRTSFLYNDNFINEFNISVMRTDFSNDLIYNEYLSESEKKEWFDSMNYTLYYYNTYYITKNTHSYSRDYGYETAESYEYATNSEDGLGEYVVWDNVNDNYTEKRISKGEADAIFAKHGSPITLNDGFFVIN